MPTRVLAAQWDQELQNLAATCKDEFMLASPYITLAAASRLLASLGNPTNGITCLTDLSPRVLLQSTQTDAIRLLARQGRLYHLAGVHAKVFIADKHAAIVSSGNLTEGGTRTNFELGLCVDDPVAVAEIRSVIQRYIASSASIGGDALERYLTEVDRERLTQTHQQISPAVIQAFRKTLPARPRSATFEAAMVKQTSGLRTIFRDAILTAIELDGAQGVDRLYDVVQGRHPEFCDDAVKRGKPARPLWRHEVRFALEELKQEGIIERIEVSGRTRGQWRKITVAR